MRIKKGTETFSKIRRSRGLLVQTRKLQDNSNLWRK